MGVMSSPPRHHTREAYLESAVVMWGQCGVVIWCCQTPERRLPLQISYPSLSLSLCPPRLPPPLRGTFVFFCLARKKEHAELVVRADAANVADNTFISLRARAVSGRLLQSVDKPF